ncbi:isochorismate synthase [Desulfatibacillum aliphaticivorans]|uniref:isochorismate synthase n=1 Tax=Desulfatibacillum aliphaticivorans TaxID=218208 RepID=UPI00041D3AF7|nr:isochorismate synthase [Desulfatibacillum aliphaticivorans]
MLSYDLMTLLKKSAVEPGAALGENGPGLTRWTHSWQAQQPESLLQWLAGFNAAEQFYFSGKSGGYETAGLGQAMVISGDSGERASATLSRLWARHPQAMAFGGTAFAPDQKLSQEWTDFGPLRFTIPVVELRRNGSTMELAFNHFSDQNVTEAEAKAALQDRLRDLEASRTKSERKEETPCSREQIPSRKRWNAMILNALDKIKSGVINKVVLSRKMILTARKSWDAAPILARLAEVKDDSFVFFYKIAAGKAFFGRTPERLLKLEGRSISVDAIAGTRPRGRDAGEDLEFEKELLDSSKEMEEHRIVSRYVEEQMDKIARDLQTGPCESILKLGALQHIFTQHCGELRNGHNVLDTLACFHPTPAVGGHPAREARALILEWEPHRRGWYAGPIGWMTGEGAEFAVGIRSALADGNRLHIFAGAGIVEESDPDSEWLETEQKMQTITRASGLSPQEGEC